MDSKYVICILVLMLVGCGNSDIAKDKEECTPQLAGLATCLAYVGGQAKAPTPDCCSGVKQVLQKSKKCVCILIKDRNDPSLGLKINATLALGLPGVCQDPSNITASQCVALLNLAPNSPEAKMFYDLAGIAKGNSSTNPAVNGGSNSMGSSSAEEKSEGARIKRWLAVERVCLVITSMVVHLLTNP